MAERERLTEVKLRACGSSRAHSQCKYAGDMDNGIPICAARDRVRDECPFKSKATIQAHLVKINLAKDQPQPRG